MNHALRFIAALICLGFACAVVWIGRHGLTHFDEIMAAGALVVGFALALGTDFWQALDGIKPFLPWLKPGSSAP